MDRVNEVVTELIGAGFQAKRFEWPVNLKGRSKVSMQISTDEMYREFPNRSVAADVHGILMRVASLQDTLTGKIVAWRDHRRRPSKRQKDLLDIMRLVESHPELSADLPPELTSQLEQKGGS